MRKRVPSIYIGLSPKTVVRIRHPANLTETDFLRHPIPLALSRFVRAYGVMFPVLADSGPPEKFPFPTRLAERAQSAHDPSLAFLLAKGRHQLCQQRALYIGLLTRYYGLTCLTPGQELPSRRFMLCNRHPQEFPQNKTLDFQRIHQKRHRYQTSPR